MKKMYSNPICVETELVSVATMTSVSTGGDGPQLGYGGNEDNPLPLIPGTNPIPQ